MRFALLLLLSLTLQSPPTSAHLTVGVIDSTGAVLPAATVMLSGPETQAAVTDGNGQSDFPKLLPGRYEAIVMIGEHEVYRGKIELERGANRTYRAIVAPPDKPRLSSIAMACGGEIPDTLAGWRDAVDDIVRVRIEGQQTFEYEPSRVVTAHTVTVLESFKGQLPFPVIYQFGGDYDRGDAIVQATFNSFPVMWIGQEYVLFVKDWFAMGPTVHFAQEGAFEIHDGRIRTHGTGILARAWNGRPAEEFLIRLRGLRRSRSAAESAPGPARRGVREPADAAARSAERDFRIQGRTANDSETALTDIADPPRPLLRSRCQNHPGRRGHRGSKKSEFEPYAFTATAGKTVIRLRLDASRTRHP